MTSSHISVTRATPQDMPSTVKIALQPSEVSPTSCPNGSGISPSTLLSYCEAPETKTSLDITQKLEKKLAHLNASESVFKRWFYEIVSWSISALCMGGIVVILLCLNNRGLSTWPDGLTIYTVLSKVASAALILPTSEGLGQLKWSWFNGRKAKEIWDFEIFDKASRGAWGSILLLFRPKGRSLAALGAILTVLLIANDTFFQQVVDLPERWILEKPRSSIARLKWYESENSMETKGGVEVIQMEQSLRPPSIQFFYGNGTQPIGNGTSAEIPISCPTSNCTWPEYETLGMCSKCVSISELIKFACTTTRADWIGNLTGARMDNEIPTVPACGYFLDRVNDLPLLISGYSTAAVDSEVGTSPAGEALLGRSLPLVTLYREPILNGSINFKNIGNSIVDVVIASASGGIESVYRNETPIAQECVLYWCVKRLRSSYYWASYQEEIVSTFANTTPGDFPWKTFEVESNNINGTDITYTEDIILRPSESSNDTYGTSRDTHSNIIFNFDDVFPSFTTADNTTSKPVFRNRVYTGGGAVHRRLSFNPWLYPNNVTHHMERLATAFTNTLRSTESKEIVYGSAFSNETYVQSQWGWLAFPFVLLILTLVFLAATIIKTKASDGETDPGIWKTSAMPTLIYSLPSHMQKQFTHTSTWSTGSAEKSRSVKVRLHPGKGWRISEPPGSVEAPWVVVRSNHPPTAWI